MRKSITAFAFLGGLAIASVLSAGTITVAPCGQNTLAFYETLTADNPCSIGILLFSNFTFSKTGSGATETPTDIILNPFANADDVGGGFGFSRAPQLPRAPSGASAADAPPPFTVGAGQTATYIIDWLFVIDPGPVGSGADLGMDPPFGDIVITQNYCLDSQFFFGEGGSVFCTNDKVLQTLSVDVANPTDHKNFHPPADNYGNVMTTIALNGITQTGNSGFDSVSSTSSVTPEPASIVLAFAGLLGIAARRKFKRQG